MRVSDDNFMATFLRGITDAREAQNRALEELADGKRVRHPSDDPIGARTSLGHRARLARLTGYDRAAAAGRANLETLDLGIGSAIGILTEARTLALAGASSVTSQGNDARAVEVDSLRERLLDLANSRHGERYVFAGTATDARPFDDAGAYLGSAEETLVPVSDTRSVGVTVAGDDVFHSAGNVFVTLDGLSQALRADDTAAIEAAVAELTVQMQALSTSRAVVGARMQAIDAAVDVHSDERLRLERRISSIEDIAVEEVAVRLAAANTSLNALAASASSVLGRSLFEFLA